MHVTFPIPWVVSKGGSARNHGFPANRPTGPKVCVARFPVQIWVPCKGLDLEGKFLYPYLGSKNH